MEESNGSRGVSWILDVIIAGCSVADSLVSTVLDGKGTGTLRGSRIPSSVNVGEIDAGEEVS
jgi:hypothetical protein